MLRRFLVLGAVALYAAVLATWFSMQHIMALDEFFAMNVLADPSWRHAVGSWNQGADSGGILYYALLWPMEQAFHGSVLVARLFSTACYFLSAVVWCRILARFLDEQTAALGVLLVWLSSPLLLVYMGQVRFYTPFLLFAAIAVWATLRACEADTPLPTAAILVLTAHTCLVLIHMLGIIYSALIASAALLCLLPRRRALVVTAGIALSWVALLPCHTAIRNGSANATSQFVYSFGDVLRFCFKASVATPVVLLAFLGLVWFFRERLPLARSSQQRATVPLLGPVLSLAFLAGPLALYLLSIVGRPLGAARYMLPYYLSVASLCGCALFWCNTLRDRRFIQTLQLIGVCLLVALHISAIRQVPPGPTLQITNLGEIAAGKPVVVLDEQTFFELQYYRSTAMLQFHFLIAPAKDHPNGMMATVASRGYFPGSMNHIDEFERMYPEFLLITSVVPGRTAWVESDPSCHVQPAGTVVILGISSAVLDVTGCRPKTSDS